MSFTMSDKGVVYRIELFQVVAKKSNGIQKTSKQNLRHTPLRVTIEQKSFSVEALLKKHDNHKKTARTKQDVEVTKKRK